MFFGLSDKASSKTKKGVSIIFTNDLNNSIEWKNNHTKEPWGRNYVAMEGNSWACTQEKYIGYVNMDYKTSTKTIEICTCIDSPCSDNSNIEKYETQWE